ncbi:hypothetical protein GCM10009504_18660 [Pseudomonas laurentiana]|nr:hypothetical protein GCM10009504_18660 [Pseudomonas laurentiana]
MNQRVFGLDTAANAEHRRMTGLAGAKRDGGSGAKGGRWIGDDFFHGALLYLMKELPSDLSHEIGWQPYAG